MLLRRSILEKVGIFDEIFGMGYCEESDLCMRLTTQGYRTVIADDVYVYHKGRASFQSRGERYINNRKIFDERWKEEYEKQFKSFLAADPLKSSKDLFAFPQELDPIPSMRETYRSMRAHARGKQYKKVVKEAIKGVIKLPKAKREVPVANQLNKVVMPNKLRVTYVLNQLAVAGGVLSVIQLVNELILLGVEARIVALKDYPEIYDWKLLTQPIIYKDESEMLEQFPESDIVVATHWTTAGWVAKLVESGKGKNSAYFLQDYESWFYPESDRESRKQVIETYKWIQNKIVKSDWLRGLLAEDGYETKKIRLGMDLGLYYPRRVEKKERPVVLAMARPRTERRGFPSIVEALKQVKDEMPEVEIILFGDDLSKYKIPFEYTDMGVITNQNKLAELYTIADVYLDGSDFQGFGRPALEAMACETACVLTKVGGVIEYAKHNENCLLVTPKVPREFADAIVTILKDNELQERFVKSGLKTVKDYCHKREGRETLEYFHEIINQ
jgi:glycosyltransferase involved in cell wall biosynthesis